jgi:membrane fusion protein (multidrug efflux system)
MTKRLLIAIILLALVGGGLVGFNLFRDRMIADFFADMPVNPATVSTVEAEPVEWQPGIDAIGTAFALRGVDLSVEAGGIVREIGFAPNESVEAGRLLLRLDDTVQRADLAAAETQLDLEMANFERARQLQSRGVTTNVSLEGSEAAARAAEAQVARANALLEQRRLVAPFDGTIGLPRIDLGQYIQPGTVIATLQDTATMRVDFSLPEQQLAAIAIGQPVHVRADGVERDFDGEIVGIDPRVDPASRMVAVRGAVEADGALTPGQFVRIRIDMPKEEGVIALPQTAVTTSLYGDYVYAVRPSETDPERLEARQVFVELGRRSHGMVEILSGLNAGETVVSAGQNRLSNGQPVVIDNSVNPSATRPLRASL